MSERRQYFRTSTKETTDGLIENFRLNMLPSNQAVREHFGIVGQDGEDERLFDALRWMWNECRLTRERLLKLKNDGPALTEAVNVPENPFAPVKYETMGDLVRAVEAEKRAEVEELLGSG